MANPETLVDLRTRTPEERRRIASAGGKASVIAKRNKKTLLQIAEMLLNSKPSKDIEEKLRNHGVSEELIKEFLNALNDCEFARFAPGDENQAMDKVYSSSIEVISRMENSIKH